VGVAEEDVEPGVDAELSVLGELCALVPGQGPTELVGQRPDRGGDRIADGFGAVAGQRRAVVDPRPGAVAVHAGQVQQHGESGGSFNERADRGALETGDEVAFRESVGRPGGSGVAEVALRLVANWECPPGLPGVPVAAD